MPETVGVLAERARERRAIGALRHRGGDAHAIVARAAADEEVGAGLGVARRDAVVVDRADRDDAALVDVAVEVRVLVDQVPGEVPDVGVRAAVAAVAGREHVDRTLAVAPSRDPRLDRCHEARLRRVQHPVVRRSPAVVVDPGDVGRFAQRIGDVRILAGRQRVVGAQRGARRDAGTADRVAVAGHRDAGHRGAVIFVEVVGQRRRAREQVVVVRRGVREIEVRRQVGVDGFDRVVDDGHPYAFALRAQRPGTGRPGDVQVFARGAAALAEVVQVPLVG
ncbi:MAG: hypothetical protein KF786_11060 [Burkholderiaceae bacterium]|nr:hypothetical protein [Burkholderiaceae bacterium]